MRPLSGLSDAGAASPVGPPPAAAALLPASGRAPEPANRAGTIAGGNVTSISLLRPGKIGVAVPPG